LENTYQPFFSPLSNAGARGDAVTVTDLAVSGTTVRPGASVAELASSADAAADGLALFFTRFFALGSGPLAVSVTGLPQVIVSTDSATASFLIATEFVLADFDDGSVTTFAPEAFNLTFTIPSHTTFNFGGTVVTSSGAFELGPEDIGHRFSLALAIRASAAAIAVDEPPTLLLLCCVMAAVARKWHRAADSHAAH
jgi:hypothetical protein